MWNWLKKLKKGIVGGAIISPHDDSINDLIFEDFIREGMYSQAHVSWSPRYTKFHDG